MNVFLTAWTDDVCADRPSTDQCVVSRRRTTASQPKTGRGMRTVRMHLFEVEMVLRAIDRMKDWSCQARDMDAADYFYFRGAEIKKVARIRKARGAA